jgi:hypothetical protein
VKKTVPFELASSQQSESVRKATQNKDKCRKGRTRENVEQGRRTVGWRDRLHLQNPEKVGEDLSRAGCGNGHDGDFGKELAQHLSTKKTNSSQAADL